MIHSPLFVVKKARFPSLDTLRGIAPQATKQKNRVSMSILVGWLSMVVNYPVSEALYQPQNGDRLPLQNS
ncbi:MULTISPECIES: hypothetical protein [unclassified Limnospira]|uniref:hypothetical protein n=1 Tax=unclassified Limnospira TaxID=2642885 RepID=UPI000AEA3E8D|nr:MULTISPECIES: hypothetical protein [unclassified Limnospira]